MAQTADTHKADDPAPSLSALTAILVQLVATIEGKLLSISPLIVSYSDHIERLPAPQTSAVASTAATQGRFF